MAVAAKQTEAVRVLLSKGASPAVLDGWGQSPLLEALKGNALAAAELIVARGAKLDKNLYEFVKEASEEDATRLALACMKAGADPNSHQYDQRSVLHSLCLAGNLKAVEALLAVGADVNAVDRCAHDALYHGVMIIMSNRLEHLC